MSRQAVRFGASTTATTVQGIAVHLHWFASFGGGALSSAFVSLPTSWIETFSAAGLDNSSKPPGVGRSTGATFAMVGTLTKHEPMPRVLTKLPSWIDT
jgi:hypothetical protein